MQNWSSQCLTAYTNCTENTCKCAPGYVQDNGKCLLKGDCLSYNKNRT